jgi:hypothetical protein
MPNPALDTMTVAELRKLLDGQPDDAKVVFAYSVGDYWKTVAVGEIKKARTENATYSGYNNGYRLVTDEDEDEDEDERDPDDGREQLETVEVLVLG